MKLITGMKGTCNIGDRVFVKRGEHMSKQKTDCRIQSGKITKIYEKEGKIIAADVRCPIEGVFKHVNIVMIEEDTDSTENTPKRDRASPQRFKFSRM